MWLLVCERLHARPTAITVDYHTERYEPEKPLARNRIRTKVDKITNPPRLSLLPRPRPKGGPYRGRGGRRASTAIVKQTKQCFPSPHYRSLQVGSLHRIAQNIAHSSLPTCDLTVRPTTGKLRHTAPYTFLRFDSPSISGLEPDDAAPGSRLAHRSPCVGAECSGDRARRYRRCGAPCQHQQAISATKWTRVSPPTKETPCTTSANDIYVVERSPRSDEPFHTL